MLRPPYRYAYQSPAMFGGGAAGVITTWNPSDKDAEITLSGGNLTAVGTSNNRGVRATQSKSTGQYVFEVTVNNQNNSIQIGLAKSTASLASFIGNDADGWGYHNGGAMLHSGGNSPGSLATFTTGDVIGIGFTNGDIKAWKNGSLITTQTMGAGSWFAAASLASPTDNITANFGATAFAFTYAGFSSWNSA